MTTMNISLTPSMRDYVEDQVRLRDYSSGSEYMRHLIRKDQAEQTQQKKLEALRTLLQERLQAPHDKEVDEAHFRELEALLNEAEHPLSV